jgi:hypothetical protein
MTTAQPTPLELRIAEVAQYEANIAMFKAILATLPTEWPEHLAQYKGATSKHETSALIQNLDDVELVSKLWYADECFAAIRSEMVEMQKAKAILAVLQNS